MQITVRVNGVLAQEIGMARFPMTLLAQATVRDLIQLLASEYPILATEFSRSIVVVNGVHLSAVTPLENGQEVALLMPVAGG